MWSHLDSDTNNVVATPSPPSQRVKSVYLSLDPSSQGMTINHDSSQDRRNSGGCLHASAVNPLDLW